MPLTPDLTGSLRIYRAPGSVAFLSCGDALQPILPKSQCWCLDERNTTFILQIRRPNYWRIELPSTPTEEEQSKALALRNVLDGILQFEKTHCPFQRTFSIEIEEPSPTIKKPWTPRHNPISAKYPDQHLNAAYGPSSPLVPHHASADSDESDNGSHLGEYKSSETSLISNGSTIETDAGCAEPESPQSHTAPDIILLGRQVEGSISTGSANSALRVNTSCFSATTFIPESVESPKVAELIEDIHSRAASDLVPLFPRSKTPIEAVVPRKTWTPVADAFSSLPWSPPTEDKSLCSETVHTENESQIMLPEFSRLSIPTCFTRPSSSPAELMQVPEDDASEPEAREPSGRASPTPSEESFHSVSSWYSSQGEALDAEAPDSDLIANETVAASTALEAGAGQSVVKRRNPPTIGTWRPSARSPPPAANNRLSREIAQGQLQQYPGALSTAKSLPLIMIAKACELLLGPPAHLIALMVRVAAKITAGEWRGRIFGYADNGDEIPVQWDYSEDELSELNDDEQYHLAAEQAGRMASSRETGSGGPSGFSGPS